MPCCPVLLSLYCIVIVSLNETNGDGDAEVVRIRSSSLVYDSGSELVSYWSSVRSELPHNVLRHPVATAS